jgi:hypothetical protein
MGVAIGRRYPGCMREIPIRIAVAAAAVWICLLPAGGGFADAPAAPATSPAPAAGPMSSDAAAKHAKRTACLKEAKTKKLMGADKTSFLKNCIAAP